LQDLNNDDGRPSRVSEMHGMSWHGTSADTERWRSGFAGIRPKSADRSAGKGADFSFVQISDSHISEQALSYVRRFGSVTVLDGHIHQITQKVEGKISFHTVMSTVFPQPAPGTAPSAGPMKVPAPTICSGCWASTM
jgi:hypothetical protein